MTLLLFGSSHAYAGANSRDFDWSLLRAREYVIDRHVLRPDTSEVPTERAAFENWLISVDPHAYIEKRNDTSGDSLGLLSIRDGENDVVVPVIGGPAWSSGLRSAIRLLDTQALEQNTVIGESLADETYVEQQITPEPVRFGEVDFVYLGDIPSIRITGFIEGVTLRSARYQLQRYSDLVLSTDQHLDSGLVLDLRYCAGGDIFEATDLGGLWMQDRVQWVSIINVEQPVLSLETGGKSLAQDAPVAMLVSRFTASACEQLAMGLGAYLSVPVLGERTAGKCSVQTTAPLRGGYSLRITTGLWAGPQGNTCDEYGIEPDEVFSGNLHNSDELSHWVSQALKVD